MSEMMLRATIRRVILGEMRSRAYFESLLKRYPNIPFYVMRDFYTTGRWASYVRGGAEDDSDELYWLAELDAMRWKLEVVEVTPASFDHVTRGLFVARDFGNTNPFDVPADAVRMRAQSKRVKGDGENEPVIMVERGDGYSLLEGWHRVMNILLLGKSVDGNVETWRPVKLRAWIGRSS